jgi:demethylmenaquinone methyltransferase / 2-methoxy-6-polyprenyl-1,4-benzoquinol methylase
MPAQQGAGARTVPNGIPAGSGEQDARRGPAADTGPPSVSSRGSQSGRLEAGQVRVMFDRIAGVYDLLNSAMTAGLHHRWRVRAADLAQVGPGDRVLDVATGTGDLAIELAQRVSPGGEVVGSDFAERMLARARAKNRFPGTLHFEWGDALELPYAADSFDAATVGFGARNYADLSAGLAEMTRVVRPGGRVVILEITTPEKPPLSLFYRLWFDRIVPALGRLAGNSEAYAYLPNSVKRFPLPPALAAEMDRAGLGEIGYLLTAGGIIAIHTGTVMATKVAQRGSPSQAAGPQAPAGEQAPGASAGETAR